MAKALEADPQAANEFAAMRPGDQRKFVDWLGKPGQQSRSERLAELVDHIHQHVHSAV